MSPNATARLAGLLYLVLIFLGVFAQFGVRNSLIVPDDAAMTINNILANDWLFRLGFVADMAMMTVYFFLVMVLYNLFKAFGSFAALLMVLSVVISTAIMMLNMLHHFAALILLSQADYLAVIESSTLHALAIFFLDLHKYGYICAQVFFGIWLFPLGYLGYKSGYIPRIMGIMLMLACIAYLIDFVLIFLAPSYQELFYPAYSIITAGAEFSFCLWLLIMGANQKKSLNPLKSVPTF
jgi:hypothetical protein